jgi:hypothetical protein
MKDVSLVTGIHEWMGEAKGKTMHEYFSQTETLAKVSGWTNEGFVCEGEITGLGSTIEWTRRTGKRWLQL